MHKSFGRADEVLRAASGSQFTGAVALIETGGKRVFERAYGDTNHTPGAQPVYVDTRFDLASLTKLFVATLALILVDDGVLDLDEPLTLRIDEWRESLHGAITLRMLLAHTSGMNSGADYRTLFGQNVERFAMQRELVAEPGERVIYSDLGFIALGAVIERVTGLALAEVVARRFGRSTLNFRPGAHERASIPATECDAWRGRVQGFVHDEKAHLMNGVAGHAGLFGTAADVAWLTRAYLDAARGRDNALLSPSIAREAIAESAFDPVLRRGLGWALKTTDENSCGRWFSPESFGHTGFVGTCVWADPERDVIGVLLTNTVYFGRSDSRPLRAAFYEALIEDIER